MHGSCADNGLLYQASVLFACDLPGSKPGHCSSHRSLHVAPPLVHVGGHFRHVAPDGPLPHLVRVEQPLRHDAPWPKQTACVLILLCPQSLLCYSVWTHCRHQGKASLPSLINRPRAGWGGGGGSTKAARAGRKEGVKKR